MLEGVEFFDPHNKEKEAARYTVQLIRMHIRKKVLYSWTSTESTIKMLSLWNFLKMFEIHVYYSFTLSNHDTKYDQKYQF